VKRLVIVFNGHSSKYARVKSEILDRIKIDWTGYEIDQSKDVDGNAVELAKFIKFGDRLISAGGDGTATICANAMIISGKSELELGALPYGNFNDMARCFKRLSLDDITSAEVKTVDAYPLDVSVDGKHRRYGVCYFTVGLLAESTEIFDHAKIRFKLQQKKNSISYSLRVLVAWYVRNYHRRFMPRAFKLNGRTIKNATDYAAMNCTSAAGVLRDRHHYYRGTQFLSATTNLKNIFRLIGFIGWSVIWQVPGCASEKDVIEFTKPARVEIQGEGEYFWVNVKRNITITKSQQPIKIITR